MHSSLSVWEYVVNVRLFFLLSTPPPVTYPLPLHDALPISGSRLGHDRVDGNGEIPRLRFSRRESDAILGEAAAVGLGKERAVAQARPEQTPGRIREAGDRIPGRGRPLGHADREPAVPGEVLELHRPEEDRGIEARERIARDVLDTGRVVVVQHLAPHGVARHDALATATDAADQRPLEV